MSPVLSCPDRDVLHRLMLGRLRSPDSEELAEHLEECERCTAVVSTFRAEDTVVEAARGRSVVPAGPEGERVRGLIEHLRRLGPPPTVTADQTSVSGGDCTSPADGPAENLLAFGDPAEERFDFLAPPQGPGEIGRLGHYRVLRVLGQGGMGIVFEAEDVQLKRPVALKVMKPDAAAKPSARERFLREARAAAQLQHEHVVTIYQVDEAGGVPFLAMPVLKGMSLEERLGRPGALSVPQVLKLGRHIARGLQAAHERGMVHRDIKPGNLWVEPDRGGRVKILDFGLARAVEDPAHLTKSGMVVGTPAYMAPEQARGRKVDARSDLFSLGCVLYRMLTGRPPFTGRDTMAILTSLAVDTPRAPSAVNPAVPEALSALVMQLLSKNPADRPATAADVVRRLTELGAALTSPRLEALPLAEPVRPAAPSSPWAEIDITAPLPPVLRTPQARPSFVWRPSRWHGAGAVAVLVLLVLGPLGYYFGGTVVRFATNKGQVVIEVDEEIEVTVRENGAVIRDPAGKQVITLTAGEHDLDFTVESAAGKMGFRTGTFTLTRGGKKVINVRQELAKAPPKPPGPGDRPQPQKEPPKPSGPAADERGAAKWVISIGGTVTIHEGRGERNIGAPFNVPDHPFLVPKVDLAGNKQVTNAGLENLKPLSNLEELNLRGTRVSDDGLVHLQKLRKLSVLRLLGTTVGNKGLEYLKPLTNLQVLDLGGTWVSDDGLEHLKSLTNLAILHVGRTVVTDDGLVHLKTLTNLTELGLGRTRVSDAGLEHLKPLTNLTTLRLTGTPVTDAGLKHLHGLTSLRELYVGGTKVTAAGVADLRKVLPNCKIITSPGTEPAPAPDGFVPLFNGKDLDGWKQAAGDESAWSVQGGVLVGTGRRGLLFTDRADFADFDLRTEVMLDEGNNSSVFLRVPAVASASEVKGYDVEINCPKRAGGLPTGSIRVYPPQTAGRVVLTAAGAGHGVREWVTLEISARGNRLTVRVNGKVVAEHADADGTFTRGRIALQQMVEGKAVRFRNIRLKELKSDG